MKGETSKKGNIQIPRFGAECAFWACAMALARLKNRRPKGVPLQAISASRASLGWSQTMNTLIHLPKQQHCDAIGQFLKIALNRNSFSMRVLRMNSRGNCAKLSTPKLVIVRAQFGLRPVLFQWHFRSPSPLKPQTVCESSFCSINIQQNVAFHTWSKANLFDTDSHFMLLHHGIFYSLKKAYL
jgi:hypothetical protein